LGGVYKLVAVCEGDEWIPAIKISESPAKTPNPGHKHVWRVYDRRGYATADLLTLDNENPSEETEIRLRHPTNAGKQRTLDAELISEVEPLLVDVLVEGERKYGSRGIDEMREMRIADVERLDPGVRRIMYPHIYHVSLSQKLWDLKQSLIAEAMRKT
jgi:nicotinate phosphoribosyltransferase